MPRPAPAVETRMEVHATAMTVHDALGALRRATAPMYRAALASGRWDAISEAKAVADDLHRAQRAARRLAAIGEEPGCQPEHTFGFGHGTGGRAA